MTNRPVRKLIFTEHFWRTFVAASIAYVVTYLPFILNFFEYMIRNDATAWSSFGFALDHAFVSGLAVSAIACVTYTESEREVRFANNCGTLMYCSLFSAIVSLIAFVISRNPINGLQTKVMIGGIYGWVSLTVVLATIFFAFVTILQIRRARDRYQ